MSACRNAYLRIRCRSSNIAGPYFFGLLLENNGAALAIGRGQKACFDLAGAEKERRRWDFILVETNVLDHQGTPLAIEHPAHAAPEHRVVKQLLARPGYARARETEDEKRRQHQNPHPVTPSGVLRNVASISPLTTLGGTPSRWQSAHSLNTRCRLAVVRALQVVLSVSRSIYRKSQSVLTIG